jgi:hypothetical protein
MGETANQPFQLSFNAALKVEFQGSRVTSGGGLILVRELDERLDLSDLIAQHVTDPRGKNTQFPLTDLVRQSVYRRLAGYEDVNDVERLSHDPTFRLIGSEKDLGARGGPDISSALVGDRAVDPTREPASAGGVGGVREIDWVRPCRVLRVLVHRC